MSHTNIWNIGLSARGFLTVDLNVQARFCLPLHTQYRTAPDLIKLSCCRYVSAKITSQIHVCQIPVLQQISKHPQGPAWVDTSAVSPISGHPSSLSSRGGFPDELQETRGLHLMSCGVSSAAKFEQNFERMCPRTGISKVTSEYCNSGEEKDDHVGEVDWWTSGLESECNE